MADIKGPASLSGWKEAPTLVLLEEGKGGD